MWLIMAVLFCVLLAVLLSIRSRIKDLSDDVNLLRSQVEMISARPPPASADAAPAAASAMAALPVAMAPTAPPIPAAGGVSEDTGASPAPPIEMPSAVSGVDFAAADNSTLPHEDLRVAVSAMPEAAPGPVAEILRRIWRWILVGDEQRQAHVSLEYALATTWLMRAGIVALLVCVGYFLKWSMAHGFISDAMRVGISILAGVAMLIAGIRMQRRQWRIMGQGFLGGGLGALYFSLYAAGPMYELLPVAAVFALMIMVTGVAGLLAVRLDSMLVAILGLLGGFGTPVMLSSGTPRLEVLYSYLLLLNFGILCLAYIKQWRLLNYLGFALTWALFAGALPHYARADFAVALSFLSAFFLTHAVAASWYNLRHGLRATLLEMGYMLVNVWLFAAAGYGLIHDAVGRPYPALLTMALALFYLGHIHVFLRRCHADRAFMNMLLALAALFAALTLPLAVEKESLTMCWALTALMFLWLGGRLNSGLLRGFGMTLYLVVFFRLLALEVPEQFMTDAMPATFADYGRGLARRLWTFGVSIGAVLGGFYLERRRADAAARGMDAGPAPAASLNLFFWPVVLLVFLLALGETHLLFAGRTLLRPLAFSVTWCGLAVFFRWRVGVESSRVARTALCLTVLLLVLKSLGFDMAAWRLADGCYHVQYSMGIVGIRMLNWLVVLGGVGMTWRLLARRPEPGALPALYGYGALALLFLYLTLELHTLLYWKLPEFQGGGISVFWTLFAAGCTIGGIWKNVKGLRYAGLALFAVVIGKVFLSDLARMPIVFRMLAFMGVGVLLLLGSGAYLRAARMFTSPDADTGGDD